jgi:hypothetical protein
MKKFISGAVAAALIVTGCASAPGHVAPAYVSPTQFSTLSCAAIGAEGIRLSEKVAEVTGKQQSKADSDAVAMGVGMLLFWPALFILASGQDHAPELARLKGEVLAQQQAWNEKDCGRSAPVTAPSAS